MILRLPTATTPRSAKAGPCFRAGSGSASDLPGHLYGSPKLVILDEPNASLDIEGDEALNQAIATMKEKGTTVIVIGHRPSTLSQVERILVLRDGRVAMFGPRADVIEALKRQRVQPIIPSRQTHSR